jgi:hypothetical protein
MDEKDLDAFTGWFHGYAETFYTGHIIDDEPIRIKQEHTERVCEEIRSLSNALKLSSRKRLIAETSALFHDVGRFKQYADYKTFKDASSENHAALGLRELERYGILSRCEESEKSIICGAIGYHNCRSLPQEGDETVLFFAKLLRDADKLDIWRVLLDYYEGRLSRENQTLIWDLPDRPVYSQGILKAFDKAQMADIRYMETLCDYKLVQISWVFDLNFPASFFEVQKRRYIERIAATLPATEQSMKAVERVKSYVSKRLDEAGRFVVCGATI